MKPMLLSLELLNKLSESILNFNSTNKNSSADFTAKLTKVYFDIVFTSLYKKLQWEKANAFTKESIICNIEKSLNTHAEGFSHMLGSSKGAFSANKTDLQCKNAKIVKQNKQNKAELHDSGKQPLAPILHFTGSKKWEKAVLNKPKAANLGRKEGKLTPKKLKASKKYAELTRAYSQIAAG